MKLKIPTLKDASQTLSRWGAEIRRVNFLTDRDITWTSWQPEWSTSGSLTYTIDSQRAEYLSLFDKIIFIDVAATGTTGGVASNTIYLTLPVPPDVLLNAGNILMSGHMSAVSVPTTGYHCVATSINDEGKLFLRRYDSANWPLGTVRVFVQGWYRALQ